jgi:hypothetical protein
MERLENAAKEMTQKGTEPIYLVERGWYEKTRPKLPDNFESMRINAALQI